jgi:hypothetical protein
MPSLLGRGCLYFPFAFLLLLNSAFDIPSCFGGETLLLPFFSAIFEVRCGGALYTLAHVVAYNSERVDFQNIDIIVELRRTYWMS